MIQITSKDINQVPEALTRLGALRKINRAITGTNGEIYDGYYYKDSQVLEKLKAHSLHKQDLVAGDKPKCYYCESTVDHVAKLQVEHYRPKAKVDKVDNNDTPHSGYYWLGLEWSNLLLSCPNCNGKEAKGNRFPIRNFTNRALPLNPINQVSGQLELDRSDCLSTSDYLQSEEPLLINPEVDNPSEHLTFDPHGQISGTSDEGIVSVEIYTLDRDPLLAARQSKINDIIDDINLAIAACEKGRIQGDSLQVWFEALCQKLFLRFGVTEEYALWLDHVINNFSDCILEKIDEVYRERLLEAFETVRNI